MERLIKAQGLRAAGAREGLTARFYAWIGGRARVKRVVAGEGKRYSWGDAHRPREQRGHPSAFPKRARGNGWVDGEIRSDALAGPTGPSSQSNAAGNEPPLPLAAALAAQLPADARLTRPLAPRADAFQESSSRTQPRVECLPGRGCLSRLFGAALPEGGLCGRR